MFMHIYTSLILSAVFSYHTTTCFHFSEHFPETDLGELRIYSEFLDHFVSHILLSRCIHMLFYLYLEFKKNVRNNTPSHNYCI